MCGRLAQYVEGIASVRLRIPPPLDVALEVEQTPSGATLIHDGKVVAEARSSSLDLEIPPPPTVEEAEAASRLFPGFKSHRFPSCFVCGPERQAGEGLHIFAGPVAGRNIVACTWTPDAALAAGGRILPPEFTWAALDCPGGFSFPEPPEGTILLGELTTRIFKQLNTAERLIVMGWEISHDGRKHHTGTALFSESGACHAIARAIWIEVTNPPG